MFERRLPDFTALQHYIAQQGALPFTYAATGHTRGSASIAGFDNDALRVAVGQGEAGFARACEAIRRWQMFPSSWTRIFPANAPIESGTAVAMYARVLGLWWANACRIVYVVDEPDRYGFAYGTLPGHVECGEELFCVAKSPDGTVWYEIRAFSRPRHWLARLGYPFVRWLQARFRRHSAAQVKNFVQKHSPNK